MAGTIEKRGKNTWRYGIQVLVDGDYEWVRETVTLPDTKTEAAQRREVNVLLAKLIADVSEGRKKPVKRKYTVRSFSELWVEEHVKPNLTPNAAKTYLSFLNTRILPELGDIPLKQLTPLALTKFLNALRTSPKRSTSKPNDKLTRPRTPSDQAKCTKASGATLSPRTICHYHDCLKAMLDKAVQWDIIAANPMNKVDRPKAPKVRASYLTEERAVELLRCLAKEKDMSFRASVLLAIFCGLRLGEVGALRLSDVDWQNGTIDIARALKYSPETGNVEGDPKSESGKRLIALPATLMAVLHESREYQRDIAQRIGDLWVGEGWIAHGWNGARLAYGTPSKQFRRFADKNGFEDVKFHSLRHTHATLLLANNIDAVAVATRLGHADATVTLETYAHALRRRDVDAANAIEPLFERVGLAFTKPPIMAPQSVSETPPPDDPYTLAYDHTQDTPPPTNAPK